MRQIVIGGRAYEGLNIHESTCESSNKFCSYKLYIIIYFVLYTIHILIATVLCMLFCITLIAACGQFGNVLVIGVTRLSVQDLGNLFPRFAQAAGAVGHLVFDQPV